MKYLKAGIELDKEVAEKVMGWKDVVQPHPELTPVTLSDLYASPRVPMPRYSTDIAAAWGVIEHLKERYSFKVYNEWGHSWHCDVRWHLEDNTQGEAWFQEQTAPHAICLAALKAVGAL